MNSKNNLSDEELLEILKDDYTPSDYEIDQDSSNVTDFIKDFRIRRGDKTTPNFVLYYLYKRKWRYSGDKISYIEFCRKLNKLFDTKRTEKIRSFLIERNISTVSPHSPVFFP